MELVTSTYQPPKPCKSKQGIARQSAEYKPSVWGDYFITHPSLSCTHQEPETWIKQRVETLKNQVRVMLRQAKDPLFLVDALQRLGVDYHFEKEIDEALSRIHESPRYNSDDLYLTSLRFRLLRQHRYNSPSDVFSRFQDEHGNFKDSLSSDVKGLLGLYDAAFLATPGEDVLDRAISFARSHLEAVAGDLEPHLARQVSHALETPLYRRMRRLEARHYISFYEEDKEKRNDVVLELAKLDFHMLQLLHREEIHTISKWWQELGIATKLTFARDRVVECYFWILGVYFEPHYSRARMMTTKVIALFSIMDDIYDVYGTLDELQQYTAAIQRWGLEDEYHLEECLGHHFFALTSTINDFEKELESVGLSYRVHYLKESIKDTAKAWLEEAKWRDEGYVPSLENHLHVSLMTTGYGALVCASFLGMEEVATREAFDWVASFPKMIKAVTLICRLMDDVVGYELEKKRDHVASTIYCYIKEHGTSIEETCEKLLDKVEDAWKEINQEILILVSLPMSLLMRILNLGRMMETIYRNIDGYTNSEALKEYIELLLVQTNPL